MRHILLILVVAVACNKDKASEPPSAPSPPPPAPTAPTPTAPAPTEPAPTAPAPTPPAPEATPPAPSTATLTCDTLLPPSIREKYLADAKIRDVEPRREGRAGCVVVIDNIGMYSVGARCDEDASEGMHGVIDGTKEIVKNTKDLPGVGKAAIVTKSPPLGNSVTAYDDDSICKLTFTLPAKIDPTAFAKEMLALLPIK